MKEIFSKFFVWLNQRLPVTETWNKHAGKYYAPKNLNFWYYFGIFSAVVLINQIVTGIWLTMHYTPTAESAFDSVENIMRYVHFGWLLRYMHSVGASALFIVIYLHMYRGIMYGSFKSPRELVWIIGMLLFVTLLMESAAGYILPWGQMSYWATNVLVNLFTVIPWLGNVIKLWLQGDYSVSGMTLHRFFSFHVIAFPLIILFLVLMHISALHKVGSNNPDGIDIKKHTNKQGLPLDGITFHPYYTVKDFAGVVVFLFIFAAVIFYAPTMGGYFLEPDNFLPANHLVTPTRIAPPWYMSPFYSILRAIPNKTLGVLSAATAIALLFALPWLDRSKVLSVRYRGIWTKIALVIFVISFIVLGFLGTMELTDTNVLFARIFTFFYFLFFISMPFYSKYEKTKQVPDRVTGP